MTKYKAASIPMFYKTDHKICEMIVYGLTKMKEVTILIDEKQYLLLVYL